MSDDLVKKRARKGNIDHGRCSRSELVSRLQSAEAKLAQALTCLRVIASSDNIDGQFARATLARVEKDKTDERSYGETE